MFCLDLDGEEQGLRLALINQPMIDDVFYLFLRSLVCFDPAICFKVLYLF